MKKITIVFVLGMLLVGCAATSQSARYTDSGGRYQLIDIGDQPYFLDQDTGTIYSIKKYPDGKFDINQRVGRVGYMKDAF